MNIKTLTFPYEIYSRHRIVSSLIGRSKTVLDVGGSLKELKQFQFSGVKLFTTDIIGGDVIYDGNTLPFKDNAVDLVVSIDTIEHISQKNRQPFINELARVAKKRLIIAAPLGTLAHIQSEKKHLIRQKKSNQKPDKYLREHIKHGLPRLEEIKTWTQPYLKHKIIFSGNYQLDQKLFTLQQLELKIPKLDRLWYEFKKVIFVMINLVIFPLKNDVSLSQAVNRFYLYIDLQ